MAEREIFQARQDDQGRRLDRVLLRMLPGLPASVLFRLLRRGAIRVNDRPAAPDLRLQAGDRISLPAALRPSSRADRPAARPPAAGLPSPGLEPMILLETPHLLALNKPRGVLVHGPGSLEERVRERLAGRRESLSFRPGPVHRLDRNTSGIVLFAASLYGATTLSALLRQGGLDKYYLAVLDGRMTARAVWEHGLSRDRERRLTVADPLGRAARLEAIPLASRDDLSLVLLRLLTGRTHQIRVQASLSGHPLAGDRKYGGSPRLPFYILHAAALRLREPDPELGFRSLLAPLPAEVRSRLERLFGPRAAGQAGAALRRAADGGAAR